jgi:hypothetical protein
MGYVREKYTKDYFLGSVDKEVNRIYGVEGFDSFNQGRIDAKYKLFLKKLDLRNKVVFLAFEPCI